MLKTSWICGLVVVLAVFPVWGQEPEPTDLEIAVDAANVTESRIQVTPAQGEVLQKIARLLSDDAVNEADALWGDFVAGLVGSGAPVDIDALVQWVIRSAYLESVQDLKNRADRVRFYNELKKNIRREIERTTDFIKELAKGDEELTAAQIIENLEGILDAVAEDALLANVDLQTFLQKQQQLLQLLSNISKLLHDTAMSVIRKLGS